MASIRAVMSAIEKFNSQSNAGYSELLAMANEILAQTERLCMEVKADKETIDNQICRASAIRDEVSQKASFYEHQMNGYYSDMKYAEEEIEYVMSHPKTRTVTDDDGNSCEVEEIDYGALAAAERRYESAKESYYHFANKYQEAATIAADAVQVIAKFESMGKAVAYVADSIEAATYEIRKFIRLMEEEAEYNLQALSALISRLGEYLSSKPIFHPTGSISLSASGGASGGASVGSSSSVGYSAGGSSASSSSGVTSGAATSGGAKEGFLSDLFSKCFNRENTKSKETVDIENAAHEEFKKLLASKKEIDIEARNKDTYDSNNDIAGDGNLFYGVGGKHLKQAKKELLCKQGNNSRNKLMLASEKKGKKEYAYTFSGTCGPTTLANTGRQLGLSELTEDKVVTLACQLGLCRQPSYSEDGKYILHTGGGTNNEQIVALAKHLELEAAYSPSLTLEELDETIKRGGAMMMSVYSEDLSSKSNPAERKFKNTNHWVTVTGVTRDSNGKIAGIMITDTGGHVESYDGTDIISIEKFNAMRKNSGDFAGVCLFKPEAEVKKGDDE